VSPNWDALVEDEYNTIFPLTWKKKYGMMYLTQPLFAQQLGLFSTEEISTKKIAMFLKKIPHKFIHWDISFNPSNNALNSYIVYSIKRLTYHISLRQSYDEIHHKYSHDTKRVLKLNHQHDFVISNILCEEVLKLYKQNVWHKVPVVTLDNFETLKRLVNELCNKNICKVQGIFEQDKIAGSAVLINCDNKLIYLFGAANESGRRSGAMRYYFDNMIKQNCNKNLILDFEGSIFPTVAHFYKSFGSNKIEFFNLRFSRIPILNLMIKFKQGIKQKLSAYRIMHSTSV